MKAKFVFPVDQNQIAIFERIDFNSLNRDNGLAFANDADSSVLGSEPQARFGRNRRTISPTPMACPHEQRGPRSMTIKAFVVAARRRAFEDHFCA
jgi:hypothetical protein